MQSYFQRIGRFGLVWAVCALALLGAAVLSPGVARASSVYTTTCGGTDVNKNLYDAKADVYIGGGPQQPACNTAANLPDGDYYFQVTDPNGGTLLSTDPLECRVITVTGGVFAAYNPDPSCPAAPSPPGTCPSPDNSKPHNSGVGPCVATIPTEITLQLIPFADTPNNGGVYKAWIMPKSDLPGGCDPTKVDPGSCGGSVHGFVDSDSKKDNFRVKPSTPPPQEVGVIEVTKFCDLDADGTLDPFDLDEPLSGWTMDVSNSSDCTGATDINGVFTCSSLDPDIYTVSETLKSGFSQVATCVDGFCGTCSISGAGCNSIADCPAGQTCDFLGEDSPQIVISGGDFHNVSFGNVGLSTVSGTKFDDLNGNTTQDGGEAGLAGVKVTLTGTELTGFCSVTTGQACSGDAECPNGETCSFTTVSQCAITASDGSYSFGDVLPGSYTVTETPPGGTISTTGTSCNEVITADPTTCAGSTQTCNFGNACLGKGGGLTLGFWSNKNGQALINAADLTFLDGLNLRNASGTNFDPATKTQVKSWLLSATATNMSYMLSAQLTAMELNVRHNSVNSGAFIDAFANGNALPNGCTVTGLNTTTGFITIANLMSDANSKLGTDGLTPAGDPNRACWQFDKNALDNANNNLNFSVACPKDFGATCP